MAVNFDISRVASLREHYLNPTLPGLSQPPRGDREHGPFWFFLPSRWAGCVLANQLTCKQVMPPEPSLPRSGGSLLPNRRPEGRLWGPLTEAQHPTGDSVLDRPAPDTSARPRVASPRPVPGAWTRASCPLRARGSLGASPPSFLACPRPLRGHVRPSHSPGFAGAALSAGIGWQVPLGNKGGDYTACDGSQNTSLDPG